MLLQKESFLLIFLLKFIKVWMIPLFGEPIVCAYRPGVEIALAKRWSLDAFYCYQYASSQKADTLPE